MPWRRIGEWILYIHIFLTSALTGSEWSASRPGRFTLGEIAPGTHWYSVYITFIRFIILCYFTPWVTLFYSKLNLQTRVYFRFIRSVIGLQLFYCFWYVIKSSTYLVNKTVFQSLDFHHTTAINNSGQGSCLQIKRSRFRFPALPNFLRSSGSGTGSTQPRYDNWGATSRK
jgi:hypothetical protein